MKLTMKSLMGMLAAAAVVLAAGGARVPAQVLEWSPGAATVDVTLEDGRHVVLTFKGHGVTGTEDGRTIPGERIQWHTGAGSGAQSTTRNRTPKVQLGVNVGRVDEAVASQLRIDPEEVFVVDSVHEGGAADKAGLEKYDIVVSVDGESPATEERLRSILRDKKPGEELELEIIRGGERQTIEARLESYRSSGDSAFFGGNYADALNFYGQVLGSGRTGDALYFDSRKKADPLQLGNPRYFGDPAAQAYLRALGVYGAKASSGQTATEPSDDWLEAIEKRLDRIEKMLEKALR